MTEKHPPLHTTGRLASRLNTAERAEVVALLAAFPLPQPLPAIVELELGIGNGEAMAARARANPACFFIGSDVYLNGMAQAARAAKGLPNVALTNADARELLAALPTASVARVVIAHPDPWPKASHHKRRLVQLPLLTQIARVLRAGGELWVVTDWPDYAFQCLGLLHNHKQLQLAQTGEAASRCKVKTDKGTRIEDKGENAASILYPSSSFPSLGPQHLCTPPEWWVPTKYQQKAAALGRAAWFVGAIRK